MSIISRENPLNLQHQVCVVTSASSPLGVRVCKTLLKANAFVLGIDSKTRDATLNAGLGTHFQFEERTLDGKDAAEKIVASAKEKFGVEKLDVLVNLVEKGKESDLAGNEALTDAAIVSMRQQGKGSVISVSEDVEAEDVPEPLVRCLSRVIHGLADQRQIELTKKLASQHPDLGISFNVILPKGELFRRSSRFVG